MDISEVLERLTRRLAREIVADGRPVLVTDGDPDLVEAFVALGWTEPQPK
jgi:voltage-gated potassium channel Kch